MSTRPTQTEAEQRLIGYMLEHAAQHGRMVEIVAAFGRAMASGFMLDEACRRALAEVRQAGMRHYSGD